MKKYAHILLGSSLLLCASFSIGQTVKGPTTVLEKESLSKELSANNATALGDSFDPVSGAVSFAVTDISLPGNSILKVELRRKATNTSNYENGLGDMGGWSLDIPFIRGHYIDRTVYPSQLSVGTTGWSADKECSGDVTNVYSNAQGSDSSGDYIAAHVYWTGKFLHIPGETSENLIVGSGIYSGKQATKSNHYIASCFMRLDGKGEGVIVNAPNGNKYTFGYSINLPAGMPTPIGNSRFRRMLMVTKVQDKFGNYVNYSYESNRLISIVASDGRRIDLTYSGGNVKTVSANGRIWTYNYQTIIKPNNVSLTMLKEVVLPDATKWQYSPEFYNQRRATTRRQKSVSENAGLCSYVTYANDPANKFTFTVTTPERAIIQYTVDDIYHGSYDVQPKAYGYPVPAFENANCSIRQNITQRVVSGPGIVAATWKYNYSQNVGKYRESDSEGAYSNSLATGNFSAPVFESVPGSVVNMESVKLTTVVSPTEKIIYYVDRDADSPTQDKILAEDYVDLASNKLLKRVEYYFEQGEQIGSYCQLLGFTFAIEKCSIYSNANETNFRAHNTKLKTILYDLNGNQTSYNLENSAFDPYGFSQGLKETNSFSSGERYTKISYLHDLDSWHLGLPKMASVSQYSSGPNVEVNRTDYIGKTVPGLYLNVQVPEKVYSYGSLEKYYKEYHNDGNIKRVEYATPNRWVEYSNYKRGQAQTIATPSSTTATPQYTYKVIDDNGWLKKITDPKGNVTNYDYTAIGLLKDVIPGNAYWTPTKLEYLTTTGAEGVVGVAAGMLQQRITKGNYRKNVYYDALLRPVISSEEDLSNSATRRFVNRKFNINNKLTFEAYPSSVAGSTTGITYLYDGLSREITETRDTANGKVSAFTEYWSGNRIYTKDYKANATTTEFLAYGEPEYSNPLTISSPEGVITTLSYNIFGNPTSITQGGVTQYNVYDNNQQRCKEIRPDIGNTAFHYNATGEIDWYAQSTSVSSSTSECDYEVDAADKIAQEYDNFGSVKTVSYGDGTPAKTYAYDKNGNLETLVFGALTQSYSYDDRNNLTSEKHASDGQVRSFTYKYNALSNLSDVVYPNNHSVAFAPNALGQSTYVYNTTAGYYYAKNVVYYPSGTVDSYTYGNNLTYKLTQNVQLLPSSISFKNSANALLSGFAYTYDNNSNIDGIADSQNAAFNVVMTYDGLDRLKTAKGNWGNGIFNYDVLGNITSYSLGGFGLTYTYDVNKRLASVTGGKNYSFSYDERANVTRNTSSGVGMVYNLENQMVSAGSTSYVYDGYNRRIKKQSPAGRELYMYSKAGVLMFSEKSNGVKTNYIYLGNNLIAKDDSTVSQSSSASSAPPSVPSISSAIVSNAYSPWRVSVQGANFTSGSRITVFDNTGAQWASNVAVIFTSPSSIAFSLPSNLTPSKCNLIGTCLISFRLTTETGSIVNSSVTLPAVSAPISISGYSINQSSNPWRVNLSGANFTAGSSITLHDNNGAQWLSNIPVTFTSTSSISFGMPSNSPPSQCNKTTACVIKARVVNEFGVFSEVSITLPALAVSVPPSISQIGISDSYTPWAMWIIGANFTPQSYVTILDTNRSVWRANIPVTSTNTTSFTFSLPSNTAPSGCNLTAACTIYFKVSNNSGQSSAETPFSLRPVSPPPPTVTNAAVNTDFTPWAVWVLGTNFLPSSTITLLDQNASVWRSGINVTYMDSGYITFGLPSNSPPSGCNATSLCVIKLRVVNPDQRYAEYSLTLPKR